MSYFTYFLGCFSAGILGGLVFGITSDMTFGSIVCVSLFGALTHYYLRHKK